MFYCSFVLLFKVQCCAFKVMNYQCFSLSPFLLVPQSLSPSVSQSPHVSLSPFLLVSISPCPSVPQSPSPSLSRSPRPHFTPVCPNPPSPLTVSESDSTSFQLICSNLAIIICAMRSPGSSVNGTSERFTRITFISPR